MTLSFSSLSGGTSFTVITSTGGSKTATLSKTFPAGTYLIESMAADTNLEIYLGASDGTQVGSCVAGAKSITASAAFLYVTTVNADTNDAVTFTLKSAATLATKTDAVWAPPTITDITPSGLPNINDTTTITGTNFATNVEVKFRKSDDSTLVTPKSTVRGSATSIIAGRPDSFAVGDAPYDVIVTNPSTNLSASSLNAITAGAVPVWVTSTTLNEATLDTAFSQTIQATDADGGSSITYAIVSGALQTGLSLNSSTGAITGTPTGSAGSTTITISATDSGGNAVNRTFTQVINPSSLSINYLIVAGGGAGANYGGGGAGEVLSGTQTFALNTSFALIIGAGGTSHSNPSITDGNNSTISGSNFTTITANKGLKATDGSFGAAGTSGNGFVGGLGANLNNPFLGGGGGGAGGAGSNRSGTVSGNGGVGLASSITGSSVTYGGGGGGGAEGNGSRGLGGSGGGGNGWDPSNSGSNGSANTGGGGGGGKGTALSGAGGSGIIILSYAGSQRAYGGTVTTSGGNTIHTFTGSSSFYTGVPSGSPKATGGTITTDGNYWYHTFRSTGTIVPSSSVSADIMVIGGGGGGGTYNYGGGGGAGGFRVLTSQSLSNGITYTATVGNGGAAGAGGGARGSNGGASSFSGSGLNTINASGGGGGGGDNNSSSGTAIGASGGSGGGNYTNATGAGGTGNAGGYSPSEGNNGGSGGTGAGAYGGGGGGGAGGNANVVAGNGGVGTSTYSSWGLATSTGHNVGGTVYYAGGGGGGGATNGGGVSGGNTPNSGGFGGGGTSGIYNSATPAAQLGLENTGGGGGGGGAGPSAAGGSGIVIVRYPV